MPESQVIKQTSQPVTKKAESVKSVRDRPSYKDQYDELRLGLKTLLKLFHKPLDSVPTVKDALEGLLQQ